MALFAKAALALFTSPRLRGEVGLLGSAIARLSNPGEGDSPRVPRLRQPLTPTLSPQVRGEGARAPVVEME
jgi:hypothetical protein